MEKWGPFLVFGSTLTLSIVVVYIIYRVVTNNTNK